MAIAMTIVVFFSIIANTVIQAQFTDNIWYRYRGMHPYLKVLLLVIEQPRVPKEPQLYNCI